MCEAPATVLWYGMERRNNYSELINMWSRAQYKGVTVIIDHLDLPLNAKEQFLFVDDENMVPLLIQADRRHVT